MMSFVKNREICIVVERAKRCNKVVVLGCFYGMGKKGDFKRYFEDEKKAWEYYNKQLNKAIKKYMEKCA